jgi:GDP/UDP-N,N'-diacetylbacillosamine 2-epimerase (hydrolysing)
MSRKICVITSGRADYGLLRWVMQGIKDDPQLTLQVIVTGMHLSKTFGQTYKDLEIDEFHIDKKIELPIDNDSVQGISDSISVAVSEFTKAFKPLSPDLILILGDRFEIFSAACAALVSKIPVAHLYGGEVTSGAYDEAFRHSITKMSHIHFVANDTYRNRVIQLGENPSRVFLTGSLGVENTRRIEILKKDRIEELLKVKFKSKSLLVTFHPTTLDSETPENQFIQLLKVLTELKDTTIIFTLPNADTGGQKIITMIQNFVEKNSHSFSFASLGQQLYFSIISQVDGVIGNSSSGIIEVPSLKKGTINIGDRQLGRLQDATIINCQPESNQIRAAIESLYTDDFKKKLEISSNPNDNRDVSDKMIKILREISLDGILKKRFYDL